MRTRYFFYIFIFCTWLLTFNSFGQLNIISGDLIIQSGASVVLGGHLSSNTNIEGQGKITLKGTASQNVNMNGFTIPNLEINNAQNVILTSNGRIQNSLNFVNGKIITGNNNLTLSDIATTVGMGNNKFIETNNTGQVFKELTGNVNSLEIPVGVSSIYRPVFITTTATNFSGGKVGVRALAVSHANRPPGTADYLKVYWPITRTGITGSISTTGQYADPTDIFGTEAKIRGFFYDAVQWSNLNGTNNALQNLVGAPVTGTGGSLYGMGTAHNVLLNLKLYLQGYYTSNGFMQPVLMNQGVNALPNETDTLVVELHDPLTYDLVESKKVVLLTNGTVSANLIQTPGPYYIAVKHRNSLQTWSASPVLINEASQLYDFSSSANKAMNNSQHMIESGLYAFFSGDLNQDDFIDGNDYPSFDSDAFNGISFLYVATDLNGDGFVDGNDFPLFDQNSHNGVNSVHP